MTAEHHFSIKQIRKMTRFQILLWLERYAARKSFENGGPQELDKPMTVPDPNSPFQDYGTIDENQGGLPAFQSLFPAKHGTTTSEDGAVYGCG